jgi:hypothetical protein
MNLVETAELLTYIASMDRIPFPRGAEVAWHDLLEDVLAADAAQAAREHFTRSDRTRRLEPGDVRTRALAIREARLRSERRAIEHRPVVATPAVRDAALAAMRASARAALERYRELEMSAA